MRFHRDERRLYVVLLVACLAIVDYATNPPYAPLIAAVFWMAATISLFGIWGRRLSGIGTNELLRKSIVEHRHEWVAARDRWAQLPQQEADAYFSSGEPQRRREETLHVVDALLRYPNDKVGGLFADQWMDPNRPFLQTIEWPRGADGTLVKVPRVPVGVAWLVVTFLGFALFGLRDVLAHADAPGLGPDQAPAIIGTLVGLPGLVAAVLVAVPKVLRAWGAKEKTQAAAQPTSSERAKRAKPP